MLLPSKDIETDAPDPSHAGALMARFVKRWGKYGSLDFGDLRLVFICFYTYRIMVEYW